MVGDRWIECVSLAIKADSGEGEGVLRMPSTAAVEKEACLVEVLPKNVVFGEESRLVPIRIRGTVSISRLDRELAVIILCAFCKLEDIRC